MQRVSILCDESGIELQYADQLRQEFPRHFHEEYSVGVVLRGALALHYRGVRYTAPAGTAGVMNPGEVHSSGPASEHGWGFCNILVPVSLLKEVAASITGREVEPAFTRLIFRDADVNDRLVEVQRAIAGRRGRLERESACFAALTALAARHATLRAPVRQETVDRPGIRRICEFLADVYFADFRLTDLAQLAGMSRFHFLRVFRATTGLTPHAYLMQLRIERAKTMLAAGQPIAKAAQQCGFCDQAHLHRNFKRLLGYTPGEYMTAKNM